MALQQADEKPWSDVILIAQPQAKDPLRLFSTRNSRCFAALSMTDTPFHRTVSE